jgi:hypothetical protein
VAATVGQKVFADGAAPRGGVELGSGSRNYGPEAHVNHDGSDRLTFTFCWPSRCRDFPGCDQRSHWLGSSTPYIEAHTSSCCVEAKYRRHR